MEFVNLSGIPGGILRSWLPSGLDAERVILLPDACPGRAPLPTGTVVLTSQPDWRRFAVSDCGCGMRLLRSTLRLDELNSPLWDRVADELRSNRGNLGDLGGGNHFLDGLLSYEEETLYFLIHTGSRAESGLVDDLINQPVEFDREFERIVQWAEDNRAAVQTSLERVIGQTELVLDLPHNTFEKTENGVLIRKGAVKLLPGEITIIPSHIGGDASLVRAKPKISEALFSMSHGVGRKMSRSEAKNAARHFDFKELRDRVLMPSTLNDDSLRTEGPFAYRELEVCLSLIDDYVEEIRRFSVVAYMGRP